MMRASVLASLLMSLFASLSHFGADASAPRVSGRVVDAITGAPIAEATLTVGAHETPADPEGRFVVECASGDVIHVRAAGYLRADVAPETMRGPRAEIRLTPFRPKAVYLSVYGIGDRRLRTAALSLIETTELNALVIDLKGDRGIVPYRSRIELATEAGAQRVITIGDLPQLLSTLRRRGIYTIARIVVFKDNLVARARPELAIHKRDGSLFVDREGLAWTSPYNRDARAYNIAIAIEAAQAGFDEIQFDYARLPDTAGLAYELPWTEENRVAAIDAFYREAREALTPFNVFLAADIFGYVCWNTNDTKIGQKLEHLAGIVDYLSPMLYPSSFQFGIPGCRSPVDHPYQIVRESLERARQRTGLTPVHLRPWLQAFRDYAFGGRPFTENEVKAQIKAADDSGTNGWMLWNPHNEYSAAGLR